MQKKQMIVFAEDWGRFPSSSQQLIASLLKLNWEIIWINSIGMREAKFRWADIKRIALKLIHFFKGLQRQTKQRLPKGLSVIHPMTLPFIAHTLINRINRIILKHQVQRVMQERGFINPIVWTSLPTAEPYLDIFNAKTKIYYCCDDFTVFGNLPHAKIAVIEKRLIDEVNLIFVSSDVLAKKMPSQKTFFLDHGVDVQLFQTPMQRPSDLPLGKPIAGFFGSITNWFDLELFSYCASSLPDWNFVLIGPKDINLKILNTVKNVFYLGPKAYQDLPAYAQHWDVSLLPFLILPSIIASNPLKLKQYLAVGKPIVSTDFPKARIYQSLIYIAQNKETFVQALQKAYFDKNEASRIAYIQDYSWDKISLELEKKLLMRHRIVGGRHHLA